MAEDIDGAVKWLMKRLMQTTAESFELAFAKYETSEREAALAYARRLMESQDPAEQQLGERLKAEVLKEGPAGDLILEGPVGDGAPTNPFSSSPRRLLPAMATPSPAAEAPPKKKGPGRPRKDQSNPPPPSPQGQAPAKRGPGRRPKSDARRRARAHRDRPRSRNRGGRGDYGHRGS